MIFLTMYVAFLHVFIHPTYNDILWEYKPHWTQWVGIRLRHQLQNAGCCQGTRCFCPWGHLRSTYFCNHTYTPRHISLDIRVYSISRIHTSTPIGHIKQSDSSRCMTRFLPSPPPVAGYYDNVGGDVTDAVLLNARNNCKIAMCGSISEYDNKEWYRFIAYVTYKHTHKHTHKHTNTHTNEHTKKRTYMSTYMNVMCVTHVWIACIYTYQEGIYYMTWIRMHNHKVHIWCTITKCIYAQMHPILDDKLCVCDIWMQGWAKKMEYDPYASHLHQGEMCRCLHIQQCRYLWLYTNTSKHVSAHTYKSKAHIHTYTHVHHAHIHMHRASSALITWMRWERPKLNWLCLLRKVRFVCICTCYVCTTLWKQISDANPSYENWHVSMCMYVGKIKYTEDIREGLETYPATVRLLMSGDNTGKLILKVWENAYNGESSICVYMFVYMLFSIAVNSFLGYFEHLFCTCDSKRFWWIRPSFNKSLKPQQLPTRSGKKIRESLFFWSALSWHCSAAPQKWEAKIAQPFFE